MSIPKHNELFGLFLEALADGKERALKDITDYCATSLNLSKSELNEKLPSGAYTFKDRVGWARTYLKKAHLIISPSQAVFQITELGLKAIKEKGRNVDIKYLRQFPDFESFVNPKKTTVNNRDVIENHTPQETMDYEYNKLTMTLADSLMTKIMGKNPEFFESLVMDLLEKMGYGKDIADPSELTSKTRDNGIDGIIRQDKLGFDKIYVQAKRWAKNQTVGSQDIQQFMGALIGKGASKGLFITTSSFSKPAIEYVEKNMTANIVLIDGEELTRLMIENDLGVSTVYSYNIKRIDTDYFDYNTI